ncbi:MAG: ATP-binding domain-containing protein, partial [Cyanobacteria bacterium J06636_27]
AWLRRSLYGEHAEREAFLHGEPIICLSPVTRSVWDDSQNKVIKQIKLPTATEGIVLNAIEVTQTCTVSRIEPLEYTYKIWLVDVQVEGMPGTEKLRLLAPDVKRQYKEDLEGLRIAALENNYYWKYFYQLKEFIDDCRVAYGLTVYSSQGSTFDNVFVAGDDIAAVRSQESRRRGFYVAGSRGSDKIIFS